MTSFADDALKAKHDELRACTISRESLLRQLFHSTVSFLKINNVGLQEEGITSFLDANDISQGRYFDLSTLPSLPPSKLPRHQAQEASDVRGKQEIASEDARGRCHGLDALVEREQDVGVDGGSSLQWMSSNSTSQKQGKEHARALRGPQAQVDDSLSTDSGANQALEPKRKPQNASNARVSSSEAQEPGLEDPIQAQTGKGEQGNAEYRDGKADGQPSQVTNHLTPPDSGRNVYSSPNAEHGGSTSHGHGDSTLKSQTSLARSEAFAGTPCTPDEQSRFEEAQSIQQSNTFSDSYVNRGDNQKDPTASQADLPSQFMQGNIDVDSEMMDVPDLSSDVMSKPSPFPQRGQNDISLQQNAAMRNHAFTGMNGEGSKDLTFSRRPPMRIDTGVPPVSDQSKARAGSTTANTAQEVATPSKSAPLTSTAQSPPERMTTRVSSGALRHKSVSEILGETPKTAPTPIEKGFSDASKEYINSHQTPKSASSFTSPDPTAFKLRLNELKEKERSKLSTVVFAKQQPSSVPRNSDVSQAQREDVDEKSIEDRDYLLTLFAAQVSSPPRKTPLSIHLRTAHKTITTSDHYTDFREKQDCRILNKVYEMQASNKWSLRQLERSMEPARPVAHWDVLLGHLKWMRTDFREERKFKYASAKYLADACARWFAGSPETRKSLQVKLRRAPVGDSVSLSATPDLIHTAEDEASEATDDEFLRAEQASAPAAIFSLPPDMFVFGLNKSPVAEKLLLELPLYQPGAEVQEAALNATEIDLDAEWKTPIVPVSKYVQGKIVPKEDGPPRKRSRLSYYDDEVVPSSLGPEQAGAALEPEQEDVALFNPENKHIRDRIHAGHAFRPPSEHAMPSQRFFECRQPSQWTLAEDDELRKLVRDYSYNWSLISSCMSRQSPFTSGPERRTPWECFERWISLEGLPAEMSKVPYFRQYHERLQSAQRSYEARQQAILQQQGHNAAQVPRRRSTQPFTVERRKNNKHIHLIDAMRKNAKRRETQLSKQQHIASLAAMRKSNEAPKSRQAMHTPQEFSRIKREREIKTLEHQRALHMQMLQQQKNAQAARAGQQAGQQANGAAPARNLVSGVPNNSSPNLASNVPVMRSGGTNATNPSQTGPQMQRIMNGQMNGVLPANGQGAPHAPVQPQMPMQMGQRMPSQISSDNIRVMHEAQRVQEHQAFLQQQRQAQRHPSMNGASGSPNMQNLNHLSTANPSMLASMQDRSSPSLNGIPNPTATTSPRTNPQPQSLSSGMTPAINQISTQVKLRNPGASPEQLRSMTTEQLYRMSQQAAQHSMNAAAASGTPNANPPMGLPPNAAMMANGGSPMLNPQQYANVMRMQQASQQRGGSAGAQVNGSRSATPLLQRSGSASAQGGGGRGPSQSPRAGGVGVAGGQ